MSFKKARQEAGLTLVEAGRELGVSATAISYWERGLSRPEAERLLNASKLYGVPMEDLLNGNEDIYNGKQNKGDSGEMP